MPPGRARWTAVASALSAAGGLDHDVVAAVAGQPVDRRCAEALAGRTLRVVAGHQCDLAPACPRRRHRTQPDRPAADHHHALIRPRRRPTQRVHHHGERLDQRRIAHRDAGGQRHQAPFGHHDPVGHPAVEADPEQHRGAVHAEVLIASPARCTRAARRQRFDRHGRAVLGDPGDLVAEGHPWRREVVTADEVEVGAADAGRLDVDDHSWPARRRHLANLDAAVAGSHCTHPANRTAMVRTRRTRPPAAYCRLASSVGSAAGSPAGSNVGLLAGLLVGVSGVAPVNASRNPASGDEATRGSRRS
jgi:hypothetical protein